MSLPVREMEIPPGRQRHAGKEGFLPRSPGNFIFGRPGGAPQEIIISGSNSISLSQGTNSDQEAIFG